MSAGFMNRRAPVSRSRGDLAASTLWVVTTSQLASWRGRRPGPRLKSNWNWNIVARRSRSVLSERVLMRSWTKGKVHNDLEEFVRVIDRGRRWRRRRTLTAVEIDIVGGKAILVFYKRAKAAGGRPKWRGTQPLRARPVQVRIGRSQIGFESDLGDTSRWTTKHPGAAAEE